MNRDTLFSFIGEGGVRSRCRLRIVDGDGPEVVVVASELPDNPGVSVASAAELIDTPACHRFRIAPRRLRFYEHTPTQDGCMEMFWLVEFDLRRGVRGVWCSTTTACGVPASGLRSPGGCR